MIILRYCHVFNKLSVCVEADDVFADSLWDKHNNSILYKNKINKQKPSDFNQTPDHWAHWDMGAISFIFSIYFQCYLTASWTYSCELYSHVSNIFIQILCLNNPDGTKPLYMYQYDMTAANIPLIQLSYLLISDDRRIEISNAENWK